MKTAIPKTISPQSVQAFTNLTKTILTGSLHLLWFTYLHESSELLSTNSTGILVQQHASIQHQAPPITLLQQISAGTSQK
jgi:hypothetical protein